MYGRFGRNPKIYLYISMQYQNQWFQCCMGAVTEISIWKTKHIVFENEIKSHVRSFWPKSKNIFLYIHAIPKSIISMLHGRRDRDFHLKQKSRVWKLNKKSCTVVLAEIQKYIYIYIYISMQYRNKWFQCCIGAVTEVFIWKEKEIMFGN